MKRSRLDEILRAVFDGSEVREVPRDPRERWEREALMRLKADLRRLGQSIPECQLSVERVRDAIFRAEVRERRMRRHRALATALAGIAVLAVGSTVGLLVGLPDGGAVDRGQSVARTEPTDDDWILLSHRMLDRVEQDVHKSVVRARGEVREFLGFKTATRDRIVPAPPRPEVKRSRLVVRRPEVPPGSAPVAPRALLARVDESPRATSLASAATDPRPEPVEVLREMDPLTGAAIATEVEHHHDVVIGG